MQEILKQGEGNSLFVTALSRSESRKRQMQPQSWPKGRFSSGLTDLLAISSPLSIFFFYPDRTEIKTPRLHPRTSTRSHDSSS